MRPIRITDLPQADPLTGTELVAVVQGGVSKKTSVSEVVDNAASTVEEWANIASSAAELSGNSASAAALSQAAAGVSANSAAAAAVSATQSAIDAGVSAGQAANYQVQTEALYNQSVSAASAAVDSENQAGVYAATAQTQAQLASDSATKAFEWAEKIDGPVTESQFSARYWANVAASSGSTVKTYTAAENVGGHRLVIAQEGGIAHCSPANPVHMGRCIGMTLGAAAIGEDTIVVYLGEVTEPSWSWDTTKPVYLGAAGVPTQTVPTVGYSQIIGFPTAATKLYIDLREPIALN